MAHFQQKGAKAMEKKRAPVNTIEEVQDNPNGFFAVALFQGGPEAILDQEAQGQRSFVESDTLPTEMSEDTRVSLQAAGVKFLGLVEGDEMFQYVELPRGWKKVAIDSRWSKLVDGKGRERATIFYEAAFYKRSAHMSVAS